MSGKQLTEDQMERIKKLRQDAIEEVNNIPEGPNRRVLDGGRSNLYYLIGEKLMAGIKAIILEYKAPFP